MIELSLAVPCTVCSGRKSVQHSLRLTKDKEGRWVPTPVCGTCKQMLVRDARAIGKFVPFYSLKASQKEAEKRNSQATACRPFLEKFAVAFDKASAS